MSITCDMPVPTYFPSDVLKWIKANASPRAFFKLIQICKYFQSKQHPLTAVKKILLAYQHPYKTSIDKLPNNIWLTEAFWFTNRIGLIGDAIGKIAVCDIRRLILEDQIISFSDFYFLTSSGNVEDLTLIRTKIINDGNDKPIQLEDILKCLPNVVKFSMHAFVPTFNFTEDMVCSKLEMLELYFTPHNFNIEEFTCFILKNQNVQYTVVFPYRGSAKFGETIQKCYDKILKEWTIGNFPPVFYFPGKSEKSEQEYLNLRKLSTTKRHR